MAKKDFVDYPILITATSKYPHFVVKCEDVVVNDLEFLNVSILN